MTPGVVIYTDGACSGNFAAMDGLSVSVGQESVQLAWNAGTNTLTVNRTGATRSAGSYGVVEVAKLQLVSSVWRIQSFLATGTYGSGNLTLTWNL